MFKRVSPKKKRSINKAFVHEIGEVLAEQELNDIKQALFKIAYFEFESFAFRPDMDLSEQVHRLEFINEILEKCGLKEEYFKYRDKRKEKQT